MSHKQVDVSIKIDEEIADIVRYINAKYCHMIVTHSSCVGGETGNEQAFISMFPRTLEAFDAFIEDVFGNEWERHSYMLKSEYENNEFSRMITVRWNHDPKIVESVKIKLDEYLAENEREGY
jgi:hypothetical protein